MFAKTPALITFSDKEIHKNLIRKMNATSRLGGSVALPPGTPESIRAAFEKALVTAGKDPGFKKDWEKFVGIRPYAGVADSAEVWEAVKIYTDWNPEIMKRVQAPGPPAAQVVRRRSGQGRRLKPVPARVTAHAVAALRSNRQVRRSDR